MNSSFDAYIKKIEEDLRRGNATEYTYRGSLELLLESFGKGIDASNDPKHIACGAPDFIVEKGKVPLGYVETKDVGVDLDRIERSDQMKRYLKGLHNLILTDYLEFRWYVNGEKKLSTHLAAVAKNNRVVLNPQGAEVVERMLREFMTTVAPTVNTPKELAVRLANVTHFIKDQIDAALESGDPEIKHALEEQYKVFTDLLLPALTHKEFADLYAQTVTYGLFAAKLSAPQEQAFSLENAYQFLRQIPFLRRLFQDVNEQLDEVEIIRPYLKDIVSLLNRTDMQAIMADFGKRTRTEDPVVHFYETFLATYDPKMRESRGVYYTPEPVVQFIVRSVDEILKTRFNKPWGLADDSVKVLDPATGTGTFLYYVIQQIHDEIVKVRGQGGQWQQKSKTMLKRLFGFELLISPYVISHLKLGLLMKELDAPLEGKDERMHVYLTNTLEEGLERAEMLAGMGSNIADESSQAAQVKKMDDIMVVLGNPPYSGHSANASKDKNGKLNFIGKLLREYYFVDGAPLGERNPKWLQDDYVKFIRYGEWRINQSGQGVLAFITNHGYLDNPTFRGMRQHLMKTFDEIYVLDLHGNSKKKETTPEGGKDENVFDIQQGVAIFIGIKSPDNIKRGATRCVPTVKHADMWGLREEKYKNLQEIKINEIKWTRLKPENPDFFFFYQNDNLLDEYIRGWKITDIFNLHSNGIVTARDKLTIHWKREEIISTAIDFSSLSIEKAREKYNLGSDTRDWKVDLAQKDILTITPINNFIFPISYRPFDTRFTFYSGKTRGFICMPRNEIMKNMLSGDNFAIITSRLTKGETFAHIQVSQFISEAIIMSPLTSNNGFVFPLYTSLESSTGPLFANSEKYRIPNITSAFTKEFGLLIEMEFTSDRPGDQKTTFGPEDVFHYIYAILHSPTYRTRYAEFLKIDFPRVPLTSDKKLFAALVKKGKELVGLHLLKSAKVEDFITTYPVRGENRVEKVLYADGKVWINPTQYFGGVAEAVWKFKIGGYQVCNKWLKDRKGRVLSAEDISHYQRVVVALKETMRLMKEIDEVIPKWPIE